MLVFLDSTNDLELVQLLEKNANFHTVRLFAPDQLLLVEQAEKWSSTLFLIDYRYGRGLDLRLSTDPMVLVLVKEHHTVSDVAQMAGRGCRTGGKPQCVLFEGHTCWGGLIDIMQSRNVITSQAQDNFAWVAKEFMQLKIIYSSSLF